MGFQNHKLIKIFSGTAILALLLGYGLFQARFLIQGPIISINTPINGTTLHSPVVSVEGSTANITSIQMNDRKIYVDEQGNFKEQVILSQGYNVVTVEATDRFGRITSNEIELIHTPVNRGDQLSQHPEKKDTSNEPS